MKFIFFKKSSNRAPGKIVLRADFEKMSHPGVSPEASDLAFGISENYNSNVSDLALFLQKTSLSKAVGSYSPTFKPTKGRGAPMASAAIFSALRNTQRQQYYRIPDWATVTGNLHPSASGAEKIIASGIDAMLHPLLATMPRSYWDSVMEPQYIRNAKGRLQIAVDKNGREIRKFNPYNFVIQMASGLFSLTYLLGEQIDPLANYAKTPSQNQIIGQEHKKNNEIDLRRRTVSNKNTEKNVTETDRFGRDKYNPEGEGAPTPEWRAVYHNGTHYMDAAFINGKWEHAPAGQKMGSIQVLPSQPLGRATRRQRPDSLQQPMRDSDIEFGSSLKTERVRDTVRPDFSITPQMPSDDTRPTIGTGPQTRIVDPSSADDLFNNY